MLDKDRAVQGIGVYAEFARDNQTTQIIIVPDGFDNAGVEVRAAIISRKVSDSHPKKTWQFAYLPAINVDSIGDDDVLTYAENRLRYSRTLFDRLVMETGWTLVQKPILVEVSRKDYDSIRARKTPTKMLYRISQSRTALGYPADLIRSAASV